MRSDFDSLENGDEIILYPKHSNRIHKEPVSAIYTDGNFYCDGSDHACGPDYYLGDILTYMLAFDYEY